MLFNWIIYLLFHITSSPFYILPNIHMFYIKYCMQYVVL